MRDRYTIERLNILKICNMTPLCEAHDYYKKMLELQGKLRRSEEERIRLEERFNLLMQESHNRRNACINRLRMSYIEFLEEQRMRDERNHKLLGTLDRVDSSLTLMTAKTERLNALKKQYEAYLRGYVNRQQAGSTTGDSGVASQNEGFSRRNYAITRVNVAPSTETSAAGTQPVVRFGQTSPCPTVHLHATAQKHRTTKNAEVSSQQGLLQARFGEPSLAVQRNAFNVPRSQPLLETYAASPRISQNIDQYSQATRMPSTQTIFDNSNFRPTSSFRSVPFSCQYPAASTLADAPLDQRCVSQYYKLSSSCVEPIQGATTFANRVSPVANALRQYTPDILQEQLPSSFYQHSLNIPIAFHYDLNVPSTVSRSNIGDLGSAPERSAKVDRFPRRTSVMETSLKLSRPVEATSAFRSLDCSNEEPKLKATYRIPRNVNIARISNRLSTRLSKHSEFDDDNRTTKSLENELERYIGKIRNLHRELDLQSLEEIDHEQNTSGDLLNVTLSDDGMDFPQDKTKDDRVNEEVEKVLALADDLASRTAEMDDKKMKEENAKDEKENFVEVRATTSDGAPVCETRREYQGQETFVPSTKDGISRDIASHQSKLEQLAGNIEKAAKQVESTVTDVQQGASKPNETDLDENVRMMQQQVDVAEELDHKMSVLRGIESEIQQYFFSAEMLDPWDIEALKRQVEEMQFNEEEEEEKEEQQVSLNDDKHDDETVARNEEQILAERSETSKIENNDEGAMADEKEDEVSNVFPVNQDDRTERNESNQRNTEGDIDVSHKEETQIEEIESPVVEAREQESRRAERNDLQRVATDEEEQTQQSRAKQSNLLNEKIENKDDISAERKVEESNQDSSVYSPESNQQFVDPNEGYENNENVTYGDLANQGYDEYGNPQFDTTPDPNVPQEYGEYSAEQYEQYQNDPNNQYVENPNAVYEENANQDYAYNYDQQYYENQEFQENVEQPYAAGEYVENYESTQDQQYLQGEEGQMENVNEDVDAEAQNVQEIPADQKVDEMSEKLEEDRSNVDVSDEKQQPAFSAEDTNETKKKKDVIKSLLDSDTTDSTIERNVSNTESDFDFN